MILEIPEAIKRVQGGEMLIVVDDEDRENEGDLFVATEKIDPDKVNFMATYGKGLICVSLPQSRLEKLNIPPMVLNNSSVHQTAFHLSCEARHGTTTGISAYDRALTMQKIIEVGVTGDDFVFPGHVFPLAAKRGGVIERTGHTEASADFAALAGCKPSGVIVEIMDDDGRMARMSKLETISIRFNIGIVTIKSLVEYRRAKNLTDSLYVDW